MVFNIVLLLINQRWIRNKLLAAVSLTGITLTMIVLLTQALPVLNQLTIDYYQRGSSYFGAMDFYIRYVVIAVTALLGYTGQQAMKAFVTEPTAQKAWTLEVYGMVLAFLSAEYLCWTSVGGDGNQYKLGLSIVWGVYALLLVILGIRNKQKHLRLAAIVLFLATLIKLFLYDLAGSGTITKTISFISLGVLLLVVSYLYNRYKEVLFGDSDTHHK
jgi:uncharacterized membrane protein